MPDPAPTPPPAQPSAPIQSKTKPFGRLVEDIPGRLNPVNTVKGFRQFLSQYGILTLAIGVVLGTAVNQLVQAVVADLITPFISLITPDSKLQNLVWTYHKATFQVGAVLDALLSFIVIAFTIYFVAKVILNDDGLIQKK